MAMAMRASATSRICAALLLPLSISAAQKQEARIIGVGNRRGAVWRIATNSCSQILCTRSSWIDSSIKKEESNAVEALALDLAKQAKALDSPFFFFFRVFFFLLLLCPLLLPLLFPDVKNANATKGLSQGYLNSSCCNGRQVH